MTLPHERYYALMNALHFLQSLLDRSKTKRVLLEIRKQARSVLKHFPHEIDIEKITKACERDFKHTGGREALIEMPRSQCLLNCKCSVDSVE